ncbi:MAG: hypothetical protein EAY75_00520 [Bacteroidetes bacterium]|nr:MAG: hypothetical protein EAY75_00520 [Bacteroidota bacterium]
MTRTVSVAAGAITTITCASATNNGTLTSGVAASGASSSVPYTGGNGGTHGGQTVTSTGVTGLTATLTAGSFVSGAGSLVYNITGTPGSSGTASFALNIGGQMCTLTRTVAAPTVPNICNPSNPTAIVEVTNSTTGKIWMDRNLGANRAATSSTDAQSYGSMFQWGRGADGHQCVNRYAGDGVTTSGTTSTLSSTDNPGNGNFILAPSDPYDWRSPQNGSLWQGVSGTNNPCPSGYRLPTEAELAAERASWSSNGAAGAFASPLKLPLTGRRGGGGSVFLQDTYGNYWSSTLSEGDPRYLDLESSDANLYTQFRSLGMSVRCLKN